MSKSRKKNINVLLTIYYIQYIIYITKDSKNLISDGGK